MTNSKQLSMIKLMTEVCSHPSSPTSWNARPIPNMDWAKARADGVWMGVRAGWKGLSRPRLWGPGDVGWERVVRSFPAASISRRSGAGMLRFPGVIGDVIGCVSYSVWLYVGEGGPL